MARFDIRLSSSVSIADLPNSISSDHDMTPAWLGLPMYCTMAKIERITIHVCTT